MNSEFYLFTKRKLFECIACFRRRILYLLFILKKIYQDLLLNNKGLMGNTSIYASKLAHFHQLVQLSFKYFICILPNQKSTSDSSTASSDV